MKKKISIILFLSAASFLIFTTSIQADILNDVKTFWVSPEYDISQRVQVSATLRKISANAYWYVEDIFWNSLDSTTDYVSALDNISAEFDIRIYPKLRELLGSEWNPGIDNDPKITVLFHSMKSEAGGYFTPNDEYPKEQIKENRSNEREMIYLNVKHLRNPRLKGFLAHEFQHLISFNQRTKIRGEKSDDDIWLNEIRSEYVSTYLGYDNDPQTSNLETRKKDFIANPSDSLTEWRNEKADYANVNLFGQYLADRFGSGIMSRIIQSPKTGIAVLDDVLSSYDPSLNFSQVFSDWLVAAFLNNCFIDKGQYCYKNSNLQNTKITPTQIFSLTDGSRLSFSRTIKDWAGQWYKFNQWSKVLKINISSSDSNSHLRVLYIVNDFSGKIEVKELKIQKSATGEEGVVYLSNEPLIFNYAVFIIFNQFKKNDFSQDDPVSNFTFNVEIVESEPAPSAKKPDIAHLQQTLENLKNQVQILTQQVRARTAVQITRNLYLGVKHNEVKILQQILAAPPVGGVDVYPEKLITGYFGPATQKAVQRFQCKYNIICSGSPRATGWGMVGPKTRAKLNEALIRN